MHTSNMQEQGQSSYEQLQSRAPKVPNSCYTATHTQCSHACLMLAPCFVPDVQHGMQPVLHCLSACMFGQNWR